ncbi:MULTISPECIES: thioredoxin family protein [Sphingobacterium]|uniref:thioredoxin family protein n=1 Tax=Sphingobacterium TaxID=28453 RepID=UPI0013D9D1F4|nr:MULTISPECIES: thioredoxin domain-containing protein [unclassified Sphingobacterium]
MKKLSVLFFLFVTLSASAQEGIKFNETKTWEETLKAAGADNKLVFVDCYTDWCAPCRWMDANVFFGGPVADYFNEQFVNIKIDMEKGEGIALAKQYKIQSYPTFLFVNSKGEVVHRTGGRMSMEEFLEEGKNAFDPKRRISYLTTQYISGKTDLPFLYNFYTALNRTDRSKAEKIAKEITDKISNDELKTELGWKVIQMLARNENDKLGAFYMANQAAFSNWSSEEERYELKKRLITSTMYGLMRGDNEQSFMNKLDYFKKSKNGELNKKGIMLEAEYYFSNDRTADYLKLTRSALNKELKDEAENLSFLARRSAGFRTNMPTVSEEVLKQAYLMAKRAVELEPEKYSIQSTFAQICLQLKNKEEGLPAAKKTRVLAEPLGSKIQRLAQELLDKVEAL